MIIGRLFFVNFHKNLCCGCSFKSPRQGDSNEHPQHRFLWKNKQNYPLIIIKYPKKISRNMTTPTTNVVTYKKGGSDYDNDM